MTSEEYRFLKHIIDSVIDDNGGDLIASFDEIKRIADENSYINSLLEQVGREEIENMNKKVN